MSDDNIEKRVGAREKKTASFESVDNMAAFRYECQKVRREIRRLWLTLMSGAVAIFLVFLYTVIKGDK